ncbi:MAG: PD-(D/E)XK nuclease family protein [Lentisphaeria bacterium]|jgi:ATP-dependent helicase/nuclease subunit B
MSPVRIFLDWSRPVVEAVAERLLADAAGAQAGAGLPPDLGGWLVLVPTRQAGRRLRERLAATAPGGLFSPRVATPEILFQPAESANLLSETQALLFAAALLGRLPPAEFTHLFPSAPAHDWNWRLGTAAHWFKLRRLLSDAGLTLADAAATLTEPEPERWQELARLETLYLAAVHDAGGEDRIAAQLAQARTPRPPAGVNRVLLAAVPDPTPLALQALERLAAAGLAVEAWIHAPATEAERFDDWGRPRPDQWRDWQLELPDNQIRLAMKPEHQAAAALAALPPDLTPANAAGLLALGVLDPEVAPHLEHRLGQRGIPVLNPVEQPLARQPLASLATDLLELAATGRFESFSRLLRHPDFLDDLRRRAGSADPRPLLTTADELQNAHLCATLDDLRRRAEADPGAKAVRLAIARLDELLEPLRGEDWPEQLPGVLGQLYQERKLDPRRPEDHAFAEAATRLTGLLAELRAPIIHGQIADAAALRAGFRQGLETLPLLPEADTPAVVFDGWLDLPWNDAPHLLLTGGNEEFLPAVVTRHLFLPDAARHALGIPDAEQRFARDLYLFTTLIQSRRAAGTVTVLLGKSSSDGDALKPSRLLFRCPEPLLPARARRLFGRPPAEAAPAAATAPAWRLTPRRATPPARLSTTQFRDYLECPFRFYLKHVLRMAELHDQQLELDPLGFGSAAHHALESFARGELRDSTDPDLIARCLGAHAEEWFQRQFAPDATAALLVQKEQLLQRLRHAARVQAQQRQAGWRILPEFTEQPLEKELIPGMTVRGRPDRVERHDQTGHYRVLDFKTADTPKRPAETHTGTRRDDTPAYAQCPIAGTRGGQRRWTDLQLPLYLWLLRDRLGADAVVAAAHFNLPKAVLGTGVAPFPELDEAALESALACARGVAAALQAGTFWPPAAKVAHESFERLCPAGEWHDRFAPPDGWLNADGS